MQLGCCCSLEQAPIAKAAGFDYLECTVVSLKPEQDPFEPLLRQYQTAPLPVRAFNVFLPGDLKVVGPEVDQARVDHYVQRAIERVRAVGAHTVVFGSGRARAIPAGFPPEEAQDQLIRFLESVADAAAGTGITVAIEPLNRKESNVLNSVPEAVELARLVNRAPVRVLDDFFHMDEEGESLDHLVRYQDWLAHVHVADSGRRAPGTGSYPYDLFAARLREAGYNGMVSIECQWGDFAGEAAASIQFLRRVLQ